MIKLSRLKRADRSLWKDFGAGVDPIGMLTYRYGANDARHKIPKEQRRKALIAGTVGGVLGGGLLVPAATVGTVRAGEAIVKGKGSLKERIGQAAVAGLKGMREPFRQIVDANRGNAAVKRVLRGGKAMNEAETTSVQRLMKGINVSGIEEAAKRTGTAPGKLLTDLRTGRVSKQTAKAIAPSVSNSAKGVNAAFGSSAAISGGTALVGYLRGENDETNFQRRLGKKVKELESQ